MSCKSEDTQTVQIDVVFPAVCVGFTLYDHSYNGSGGPYWVMGVFLDTVDIDSVTDNGLWHLLHQ